MKKVCMVMTEDFPVPAVKGGAIETIVENILKQNKIHHKIDLTVCSPFDNEAQNKFLLYECKENKIYWTYPQTVKNRSLNFIFRVIRKLLKIEIGGLQAHYKDVAKFLKKEKFDVVINEGASNEAIGRICSQLEIKNLTTHVHHHFLPTQKVGKCFPNGIFVSSYIRDEYQKSLVPFDIKVNSYILKNAIAPENFGDFSSNDISELKANLGYKKDDFIVLYVGRIIPVKGVMELIESVLHIDNDKIKLLIIGSPNFAEACETEYFNSVKQIVAKHPDRLKYLGYIDNHNLAKYEKLANVQCVPSQWEEAAGLVLLEAMESGVATIISNSGGMVEYTNDDVSIKINRGNNFKRDLAEAILLLFKDKDKRDAMAEAGKKNVKQYYYENYYENLISIIEDICNTEV